MTYSEHVAEALIRLSTNPKIPHFLSIAGIDSSVLETAVAERQHWPTHFVQYIFE